MKTRSKMTVKLMVAVGLAATLSAHAATFNSVTNGDWNTTDSWGTNTLPTASDDVVINGHAITNNGGASAECKSVTLDGTGSSLVVGTGQTLTTDAVTFKNWCGNVTGTGQVVIGPTKNLQVSYIDAGWIGISAQIVDNPSGDSAVTINTGNNEVNWTGSHTYKGGTTISGGQLNAQNVNCFGTGPVTVNGGTRLAYLQNQTNDLTINNGSLVSGGSGWNGTVNLPTGCSAGVSGIPVGGKITGPGGIYCWAGYGDVTFISSANDFAGGTTIASGTLTCTAPGALGTGPLTINVGGKADLNYVGNLQYVVLTINGVVMHPGTYGSTSSPAVNKDDTHFAGTGTVEVFAPANTAAIYTFGLPGLPAVIDQPSGNITWNVPVDYGNTSLAPDYTMPAGASGNPAPLTTEDFSGGPVKYTVTSADTSTNKDYYVTVNLLPPSGKVYVNIDNATRTGLVGPAGGLGEVWNQNPGANTGSALADSLGFPTSVGFNCGGYGPGTWGSPTLTLLTGAMYINSSANLVISGLTPGAKYDLFIPSYYWDGGSQAAFSTANTTTTVGTQYCDNGGGGGENTSWVQGVNYVLFENVEPDGDNNITVTYTGMNGAWAMLNGFQLVDLAKQADILTFTFPGATATTIDTAAHTVSVRVPYGTDLSGNIAADYTASPGATGTPVSHTARNFASPKTYSIVSQDTTVTNVYTVTVTVPSTPELLLNGSFEEGKAVSDGSGASVSLPSTDLPGWSGNFTQWYMNHWNGITAQDGTRYVNLILGTGTDVLSQSFAVTAGRVYTVSYYERIRGNGYMDTTLSVAAGTVTGTNGTPVPVSEGPAASIVQTTAVNADWTLHSFMFTPDTTTTATLSFGNDYVYGDHGDNDGVLLDNVSVLPAAPSSSGPTASFTGEPTNDWAPLTVSFTNTSTAGDAPIATNYWDFGDGSYFTNTTSANVTNTYASTGTYTVVLTVSDTNTLTSVATSNDYIMVTARPALTNPIMQSGQNGFYRDPEGHAMVRFTNAQYRVDYTLEYNDDLLLTNNWQPCSLPTNGVGALTLLETNFTAGVTQRFYRIKAQQQPYP